MSTVLSVSRYASNTLAVRVRGARASDADDTGVGVVDVSHTWVQHATRTNGPQSAVAGRCRCAHRGHLCGLSPAHVSDHGHAAEMVRARRQSDDPGDEIALNPGAPTRIRMGEDARVPSCLQQLRFR